MRPQGRAGRGRGHNCHEAETSNHEVEGSRDEDFTSLTVIESTEILAENGQYALIVNTRSGVANSFSPKMPNTGYVCCPEKCQKCRQHKPSTTQICMTMLNSGTFS